MRHFTFETLSPTCKAASTLQGCEKNVVDRSAIKRFCRRSQQRLLAGVVCASSLLLATRKACGDVIVLTGGGQVSGTVNNDTPAGDRVVLETASGIRLTLSRSQIAASRRQSDLEREYLRRAPLVANTIEDQWKLAEWCRTNQLSTQRSLHLRRIIEMNPDHARARHGLGYSFVQGQWRLPRNWQKEDGYTRYQGRWRTAQEIELIKVHSQRDAAEREWLGRIKRMRNAIASAKALEARHQILAIRDPHAVRALRENLVKEPLRSVKLLYIKTLGEIGNPDAYVTMINASLNDRDEEIFHACLDQIVDGQPGFAVEAYITGLKDANNVRVNRSAYALAQLDAAEAMVPLIDALVTSHTLVLAGSSPNSMTTTFATPGNEAAQAFMPTAGTSFSAGSQSRVIPMQVQNQSVLAALVRLTGGVSFGFNQQAWTNWHAANRPRIADIDSRRSQ